MKTTKMMVILGLMIFLTGCSSINIKESNDSQPTPEKVTTDTAPVLEDGSDGNLLEIINDDDDVIIETLGITEDLLVEPELTTEEEELTEKIKTLIDDRKAEAEGETELTEEDIELMEDILQEIVDGTSQ